MTKFKYCFADFSINEIEVIKETKNFVYTKGYSQNIRLSKIEKFGGVTDTKEDAVLILSIFATKVYHEAKLVANQAWENLENLKQEHKPK